MRFPVSVNARIFGHQPNTCRPAADEAPRRTPENTFGTQGTGYRTPLTFFFHAASGRLRGYVWEVC